MTVPATELVVDDDAIRANTARFAELTGGRLMAVLKADAFGHGAIGPSVLDAGASAIGVASVAEGLAMRRAGVTAPILSWLNPVDADFEDAVRARIDLAVPTAELLHAVVRAAARVRHPARIHLHADVGMARDGCPPADWSALCVLAGDARRGGWAEVVGVMGHMSCADVPGHPQNVRERLVFDNAVRTARRRGLAPRWRHLAATAATLTGVATGYDLHRIGAGLFGIDPSRSGIALRPALSLVSHVVSARAAAPGTGIGYGLDHVVDRNTHLALLPIGYGDGLPRSASGRAQVLVRGRRRPIVGRISMDMVVVDTGDDLLHPDEPVTLFGPGGDGEPTVAEWATWADTIEHEIVTRLGSRVARVHRRVRARPTASGGQALMTARHPLDPAPAREPAPTPRPVFRVAVIGGGTSDEHDVSRASAAAVARAARAAGHDVVALTIGRDGGWHHTAAPHDPAPGSAVPDAAAPAVAPLSASAAVALLEACDAAIPVLHGVAGEDGAAAGLLELVGVPVVGSPLRAGAVAIDKRLMKLLAADLGVATAAGVVLARDRGMAQIPAAARPPLPWVVKPTTGGSSSGVSVVRAAAELTAALAHARGAGDAVLVEQFVSGREVDVAVFRDGDGSLRFGAPLEIVLAPGEVFDRDRKYDGTAEFRVPADIRPETAEALRQAAAVLYDGLGCGGVVRFDFFVTGTGVVLNEVNTAPGMTEESQVPRMYAAAGIDYVALVDGLIRAALAAGAGAGAGGRAGAGALVTAATDAA